MTSRKPTAPTFHFRNAASWHLNQKRNKLWLNSGSSDFICFTQRHCFPTPGGPARRSIMSCEMVHQAFGRNREILSEWNLFCTTNSNNYSKHTHKNNNDRSSMKEKKEINPVRNTRPRCCLHSWKEPRPFFRWTRDDAELIVHYVGVSVWNHLIPGMIMASCGNC